MRPRSAQAERQLQMERAATADLAKQVKSLAFENAALKEDLAFFQSLMSASGAREGGISVNRFRLQPEPGADSCQGVHTSMHLYHRVINIYRE